MWPELTSSGICNQLLDKHESVKAMQGPNLKYRDPVAWPNVRIFAKKQEQVEAPSQIGLQKIVVEQNPSQT